MKPEKNWMGEPLTKEKLEDVLSGSEIKSRFFELGYGLFNVYLNAYEKYGKLSYPYDPDDKLYGDFMEVKEDIDYIQRMNGGKAMLNYWFSENRDYLGKRIFGKKYDRVRAMEKMLIDNPMLKDFVYNELVSQYLSFFKDISEKDNTIDKGNRTAFKAYEKALNYVYDLYIRKAIS